MCQALVEEFSCVAHSSPITALNIEDNTSKVGAPISPILQVGREVQRG